MEHVGSRAWTCPKYRYHSTHPPAVADVVPPVLLGVCNSGRGAPPCSLPASVLRWSPNPPNGTLEQEKAALATPTTCQCVPNSYLWVCRCMRPPPPTPKAQSPAPVPVPRLFSSSLDPPHLHPHPPVSSPFQSFFFFFPLAPIQSVRFALKPRADVSVLMHLRLLRHQIRPRPSFSIRDWCRIFCESQDTTRRCQPPRAINSCTTLVATLLYFVSSVL
jgi:hypothetical protein